MHDGAGSSRQRPWLLLRLSLLACVGVAFVIAVTLHAPYVNGYIWVWDWREPPALSVYFTCSPVLPLLLWAVMKALDPTHRSPLPVLTALAVISFLFQVLALYGEEMSLVKIARIVWSPMATSYFTDASLIKDLSNWMKSFHYMDLNLHSITHPPGQILFYYIIIQIINIQAAAYVGGLFIGILASLGVFSVYQLTRLWGGEKRAALLAAANYAALPGLVIFFPEFDQVYPLLSMAMILLWVSALERPSTQSALAFGGVLSVALFFTYNILTVGAFIALIWAIKFRNSYNKLELFYILCKQAAISISFVLTFYFFLYILTGYDPIASFRRALEWQAGHNTRPYLPGVFVSFYNFALGCGFLLIILYIYQLIDKIFITSYISRIGIFSLTSAGTLLIIGITGLIDYETTRLWLFLQPLVIVPASIELARYPRLVILCFFVGQWAIVTTLKANMNFIHA